MIVYCELVKQRIVPVFRPEVRLVLILILILVLDALRAGTVIWRSVHRSLVTQRILPVFRPDVPIICRLNSSTRSRLLSCPFVDVAIDEYMISN